MIVGVNGDSFTDMGHHDAVKYLSALRGSIRFDLENAIEADIDEVCDMDTRFYQFHISESESSASHNTTTTRTAPQYMSLTHPGKAKDIRSTTASPNTTTSANASSISISNAKNKMTSELPMVHSSPSKNNSISNTTTTNASLTSTVEDGNDDKKMAKTVEL